MKLHTHDQFKITDESLKQILSAYDFNLEAYEVADSGIENCTILVKCSVQNIVVRVYRQNKKTDEEILQEIEFTEYLYKKGIPVAPIHWNSKGNRITILEIDNQRWQCIVMDKLSGTHAKKYTDELLQDMASIQAKMHSLADKFDNSFTVKKLNKLKESNFTHLIKNRGDLSNEVLAFIDRIENYEIFIEEILPRGLCHLDYDNGNILSKNDKVTAVLDFDDLSDAPYAVCLAYTMWDIAFDAGIDKALEYMYQYERDRSLSVSEKELILPAMLFRHYVIGAKDIADSQISPSLFSHYLKLEKNLKDTDSIL